MNLATAILGSTTVRRLEETHKDAVLVVGSDRLTRQDLAAVECFNFHAARLLTHALAEFKFANLRQLYNEMPPADLALPTLGVISLAVLGAAFEAKGIGGEAPLESYARKHAASKNGDAPQVVTFDTLKERARKRERERQKPRLRRVR